MTALNIVFILDMPATNNLARAVNHSRRKQRPIDPRNLDFDMDSTSIGVEFLKGDIWVDHKRHIILASDYQLRLLTTSVHWFVDGTFKLVKAPFIQLWSIHAFVKHCIIVKQVPLMFCLMSSRRKIDYDGVLRHLLTLLGQPCVKIVTSDFEAALWQSVRGVMPHVRLVGCLFHYTQALYRQIQALGLQQSYQTDVGTKSLMRCYMALPVLPAPHIKPVFDTLVATSPHVFSPFINYIREQWIEGTIFTVTDLSVFGMETRTNNDVEGYHYRINSKAQRGN